MKGNATYFDLSQQNGRVAWWVGSDSMLDTCVTCLLDIQWRCRVQTLGSGRGPCEMHIWRLRKAAPRIPSPGAPTLCKPHCL